MELSFWIALATMGGLGFFFAGALAIANKKLMVEENPLIGKINDILPGANCGACGSAGCYDFACRLAEGKAEINGCPVGGQKTADQIAEVMGVESSQSVRMIPRVLCRGGNNQAVRKIAEYYGAGTCAAMDLVSGGDKLCYYGCLGGGDCVVACPFNAMYLNSEGIPEVIEELCTGCGMCERACPRNVIEMHPITRTVFVFCKNQDDPKTAKGVCSVACLGCGICARKSDGGVEMDNFLAVINYDKLDESKIPFDKCSTKAIDKINRKYPASFN